MIVDFLANSYRYVCLGNRYKKAFDLIKSGSIETQAEGKYEIEGDDFYYIIVNYLTKPIDQGNIESHAKYVDLQYVFSGYETIPYQCVREQVPLIDYDPEIEAAMYKVSDSATLINLFSGMFAIFFPEDGHLPGRILNTESNIHKVVFKIRV